jgi:hypothetical protein
MWWNKTFFFFFLFPNIFSDVPSFAFQAKHLNNQSLIFPQRGAYLKKRVFIFAVLLCLLVLTACAKKDCTSECQDKGYNQGECRSAFLEETQKSVCAGGEAGLGETSGCPESRVEGMVYSCCCS